MNREQVIEKIAHEFTKFDFDVLEIESGVRITILNSKQVAEAILALCYPCRDCNGSGYMPYIEPTGINTVIEPNPNILWSQSIHTCPTCKGTGKGNKMIGILDEKMV